MDNQDRLDRMASIVKEALDTFDFPPEARADGEGILNAITLSQLEPEAAMISAFNTLKPIIERNLKGSPIQYVLCLNDSRTTKVSTINSNYSS